MTFAATVLMLYPQMFPGPLGISLAGRALERGAWRLDAVQIRDFAADKHHTVDDTPAGRGGHGTEGRCRGRRARQCHRRPEYMQYKALFDGWCPLLAESPEGSLPASLGLTSNNRPLHRPFLEDDAMPKYLISFPASAMNAPSEDMAAFGEAARSVIREAKCAGVYVLGGGIDSSIAPVLVGPDGVTINKTYPETKKLDGGFCFLEIPSREAAIQWAAPIAKACRVVDSGLGHRVILGIAAGSRARA